MTDPRYIRNFSIVAHIDHGKSTLADRLLELTHTVSPREMREQFLDKMDLERERGITIKAQSVQILYKTKNSVEYTLNLIDTPGHVDFTYEVSRSLAACEGVLLLVDAVQGVEAQTVANAFLAMENHLKIIPVINKIDLPNAEPERVKKEIKEAIGIDVSRALLVSAKTGEGVRNVIEAVIGQIPPPKGSQQQPLKALIFDSFYDVYRGVVAFIRVVDGRIKPGTKIKMMATGRTAEVEEVGISRPDMQPISELTVGTVGYVVTGIKDIEEIKVGDTITEDAHPASEPLRGYREIKPMVFSGLYPIEGGEYESLRNALEKLRLNDPSFTYEPETSRALGFGFRCGFLGMLHMEIVQERLEREYKLKLLTTAPSVAFQITKVTGETTIINNPSQLPSLEKILKREEPYVSAVILAPAEYIGAVLELCESKRGKLRNMQYLSKNRVQIHYDLPLSEILFDFFDLLKSRTRGYGSLDYEHIGYEEGDLVRLDILLAGEPVDALSLIVHRDKAYARGKELVERLRRLIPRQLFEVPIQASIGNRVIVRETVRALRKDVTAKLYGGDVTRKRKLLEKQKAGKRKMKQLGKVEVPQEAFLTILKTRENK